MASVTSPLGQQIRAAREAAPNVARESGVGLSVRAAAEAAGLVTSHYQRLEGGEVAAPEPRTLRRLAEALHPEGEDPAVLYERFMRAAGHL
jgi:transcriptional regulator with XRE-family HTH domain